MAFGTDCASAARVTAACRAATGRTLIVKLSPNVTDIVSIARSVEPRGPTASRSSTRCSAWRSTPRRGGPSWLAWWVDSQGPAIKPVALRMVWQVAAAVGIPVIGMGGVRDGEDAVEFLLAGASAVAVGTANFVDPTAAIRVLDGLESTVASTA